MDTVNYKAQSDKALSQITKASADIAVVTTPVFSTTTGEQVDSNVERITIKSIDSAIAEVEKQKAAAIEQCDKHLASLQQLKQDVSNALA